MNEHAAKFRSNARLWFRLLLLAAGLSLFACGEQPNTNTASENAAAPVPAATEPLVPIPAGLDYSKFKHDNPQHGRMPCLVCHTREDNSAAMKFPGHIPCSSCHIEEFKDNNHQICSICHTGPNTAELAKFPTLETFNVKFDHGTHRNIANCADCHSPAGAALSVPSGTNAHTTCFQCHKPESKSGEQDIASCSTCHDPGKPTRTSASAAAFKFNFSHADHRGGGLNCASCHTVKAGAPRGSQVTAPRPAMHFASAGQSCATCHNNKRAFGGTDFADCKRCHQGGSFSF